MVFLEQKYHAIMVDGIIFANGNNNKGTVLKEFLKENDIIIHDMGIKKVVFIDDEFKNIKAVYEVLRDSNFQFYGIHYQYNISITQ